MDIIKIDTRVKEQEKVNSEAIPKLDQILGILPLIPARAADAIKPVRIEITRRSLKDLGLLAQIN
ncbi:hypothetical protein [Nostoc sp. LPT]|uniref:hypothetical protein n=1 Tax=Nostoc sp. LPT TaxID=2815387 RepID=UPI001D5C563D|nr:hypothetical protein [Nostoc sp. LPT]MBN4003016.1 hypothetical protein [Nostoc sp. LPT]